jgi:serine/threonine protein kinase
MISMRLLLIAHHLSTEGRGKLLHRDPTSSEVLRRGSLRRPLLYAFGLILFEMLTGVRPPGDGERIPLALRKNPISPPPSALTPEVPKEFDAIVLRCLDPSPLRRYPSAEELDSDLEKVSDFSSSAAIEKAEAPRSGKWVVAGLAALALVFVAALAALKPEAPRTATLAILPLTYEGPEEMDYLASLVPLFLGDELRESRSLEVAPFASSRTFSPGESARSVGSELGVDYVIRGELSFSSGLPARKGGTRCQS